MCRLGASALCVGWELKRMDERELLYELARAVCDELDPTALCHKILRSVSALLDAHRCSLFLVEVRHNLWSLIFSDLIIASLTSN